MTVLITRPIEDSKLLAEELKKLGIASFIEPMFHVKHILKGLDDSDLKLFDGTVFTSRHAVRSLPRLKDLPCFVVGESTALEVKQNGFSNVLVAKGNVESLLAMIQGYYSGRECRLLYLRGEIITLDIAQFLSKQNTVVEEQIVYKTDEIITLSSELVKKILTGDIKTAVFFSLNTAKIFIKRLKEQSLLGALNQMTCFAGSKKIQTHCLEAFDKVIVFESTKQLTKLLQEYYKSEETK